MGWMGKDPKISQKNSSMVTFSVGYQSTKKDVIGRYEQNFINCVCFDKTAQNALLYLKKGDKVFIDGNLNNQQYVDKNGDTRISTTLLVGMFRVLDSKAERESKAGCNFANSDNGVYGGNSVDSVNAINGVNSVTGINDGSTISGCDKASREEIDDLDDEIPF